MDTIEISLPGGVLPAMKAACVKHGISVSDFLHEAVAVAFEADHDEVPDTLKDSRPQIFASPSMVKASGLVERIALAEVTLAGALPDRADIAALLVAQRLRVVERGGQIVVQVLDDAGHVRIGNARGDDLDVASYVREVAKASPVFFRPAPEAPTSTTTPSGAAAPEDETLTEQMVRLNQERTARSARADELGLRGLSNPWLAGAENLTNQMIIENFDPARAARFKAEAGVR